MQRIAIIDVGSNSARLVITQIYKSGAFNMVYNQKEALRLAQKVDAKGYLTETAFADTIECINSFATMCRLFGADKIVAVATAAIRNAPNGKALVTAVNNATKINLEIISGETEAYMSYLGVVNTLSIKDCLIFDLGGGSTELILVRDRRIVHSISLPLGCVNLTTAFNTRNKMSVEVYNKLHKKVLEYTSKAPWLNDLKLPLIGVGGTARTVAKMEQRRSKYFSSKIHNYQFPTINLKRTFKTLQPTTFEDRKKIPGLSAERADIIMAGMSIIKILADRTRSSKLIISGCGLREGLFMQYYSNLKKQPLLTQDILARSTENVLALYSTDPQHSQHITNLALAMFDGWQSLHKLDARWRLLLKTAALLHDIGITINYYSHARHSAYMIDNARIFGLSHKEQVMAAIIAGWHNGISRNLIKSKQYKDILTATDMRRLGRMALLLALAESLDYSQTNQISSVRPSLGKKGALLSITSETVPSIELYQLKQQFKWFKKAFSKNLQLKTKEST